MRKDTGEGNGQKIEERYGELKSRDRGLSKSTGVDVKGQEFE